MIKDNSFNTEMMVLSHLVKHPTDYPNIKKEFFHRKDTQGIFLRGELLLSFLCIVKCHVPSILKQFHVSSTKQWDREHKSSESVVQKHADPDSIKRNREELYSYESKQDSYAPRTYGLDPEWETSISQPIAYPFGYYHQAKYRL